MRPPRRKELTRDVVDNNGVIDPQETQVEELEDTLFKDGCSELKRYLNPRLMKFKRNVANYYVYLDCCLLYTSPSPRDRTRSRMPSSA